MSFINAQAKIQRELKQHYKKHNTDESEHKIQKSNYKFFLYLFV